MQDGFALYLHGFVVTDDGSWTIVQQGMNGARREPGDITGSGTARGRGRLWRPHAAIEGRPQAGEIVNLTDRRAVGARGEMLGLGRGGPDDVVTGLSRLDAAHHDVRAEDIDLKRLGKTLAVADRGRRTSLS